MQGRCPHRVSPSSPSKIAAGILRTKSFQEMACAFGIGTPDRSRRSILVEPCKGCLASYLLGLSCSMNCNLLVAGMLAAIAALVECSALRADTVRSIGFALQDSALIVARIWIVWSLILTIRVGIKLRAVSWFRDHSLCHYRGCKGCKENCSCTQVCALLHDSSPCCRRDSTVEVSKVAPRGKRSGAARRFGVPSLSVA